MGTRTLAIVSLGAITLLGALAVGGPTSTATAAFPGSNGLIAFVSDRDGNDEVYVMDALGSGQTNITQHAADDFDPAWSPYFGQIAFTSDRDGNQELYTMNAVGSGVTRLTFNAASDFDPAWSPDGAKLVFASTRDQAAGELYVMNANGSGVARVTNNTVSDSHPAWSADGALIAFVRPKFTQAGTFDQVWSMQPDGMNQTVLTSVSVNYTPGWSPTGVLALARVDPPGPNLEVYAGSTRLTNVTGPDLSPAWSPDDTKIVFASARDDASPSTCLPNCVHEIYVMNADGTGQTRLTNEAGNNTDPDWQPISAVGGIARLPVFDAPTLDMERSAGPGLGTTLTFAAAALGVALLALAVLLRRRGLRYADRNQGTNS